MIIKTLSVALMAAFLTTPAAAERPEEWYAAGERWVSESRARSSDLQPARNVILFVGDGMSLTTITAARILQGQLRGEPGEDNLLFFENFPRTALSKTYNTNQQTPDSAGTMTAMATGVKTFAGSIGIGPDAKRRDCESSKGRELVTILEIAALAGRSTGVVTTTRLTHATPAALFAKAAERGWESDRGLPDPAVEGGCTDIARQMIEFNVGDGIDVLLGGGRQAFMPDDRADPEYDFLKGFRLDGRNLIEEWRERHPGGHFVWNLEQFSNIPGDSAGPLLGLFETDHMQYEHDRAADSAGEPSLAAMTATAIEMLSHGEDGFLLVVEGGRIDHAHHANNAWRALTDTLAFDDAVRKAFEMTDPAETLIIVTADHSHALALGGYAQRGNPIAGLVRRPEDDGSPSEEPALAADDRPFTVLGYHNGPGYRNGERPDFDEVDAENPSYLQEAIVPMRFATHAGEDVPVYATGPGSEIVAGVMEQNVIFHIMLQAVPALHEQAEKLKDENGLPDWKKLGD